jgi:predicted ATP-grasp superfamily ATP-dependent carboligase
MNILVTDGNTRAALAIVKSLGRKNHTVIVGNEKQPSLASSSKYCSGSFVYPNPAKDTDRFISALLKVIKEKKIDVVLPVTDITTLSVSENKRALEDCCKVPFADYKKIDFVSNKYEAIRTAQSLDIPVPKTFFLMSPDQIHSLPEDIPYPVVIKPSRSRIRSGNRWISTNVTYANTLQELKTIILGKDITEFPLLLQERIYGPGIGIFVCYQHGRLVAIFSHRRIREKPPSGGVSVLRESIPPSPLARQFSETFFDHIKWHGVAMAEFKLDHRDNIPKLMEINGRFWGSLQLAIDAGMDFPLILLRTIQNDQLEPVIDYKLGVRTRWFWGDVDALLMMLFKKKNELKLPSGHVGRMRYLLNFLKLWGKNLHYEVLSLDDIRPWIFETVHWFSNNHQRKPEQ